MSKIQELLNNMTLQEKIAQVNQSLYGWEIYEIINDEVVIKEWFKDYVKENGAIGSIYGILRADPFTKKDFSSGLNQEKSQEIIKKISDYVYENSPSKIRPFIVEESPHGHQGLNSVLYPTNIGIGATFNPQLFSMAIDELSNYLTSLNVNIGLNSGLDIVRNQKWGRTEECFSEDPILASKFIEVLVNENENRSFTICLKHFAAQGDPYLGQNSGSVNIGNRELYEIHLKGLEKHIKNADMVMAAYNEIDGVPCHINKNLLQNILRDEFGFNGVVMSDGLALGRLVNESVSEETIIAQALSAGVDLSLWDTMYSRIENSIKDGHMSEEDLDVNVKRILDLKYKLGLIDTDLIIDDVKSTNSDINYNLACESVVMTKNEGVLPIKEKSNILIVGENLDDLYTMLGDYTPIQDTTKYNTVVDAFKQSEHNITYIHYSQIEDVDPSMFDYAIVGCGGSSKRNFDMKFDGNGAILSTKSKEMECGENADTGSIAVKQNQEEIVRKLTGETKVIALFIQGRAYSLESIYNNADAILLSFYPGQMGGYAIKDIIIGKVNPSGKLPVTVVKSSDYAGLTYNNKKDFRKEQYIDNNEMIAYEFGYGLSYSSFKYDNISINERHDSLEISVDVINDSPVIGKEVVQLYVEKDNTMITKRKCELLEFTKVELLQNEKKSIKFLIPKEDLTTLNIDFKKELEKGVYKFHFGTSIRMNEKVIWNNKESMVFE